MLSHADHYQRYSRYQKAYRLARRETQSHYNHKYRKLNHDSLIAKQRARYDKFPDRQRDATRKYLYGISPFDFKRMWTAQGGLCGICAKRMRPTGQTARSCTIDHNHKTKKVRGLLCLRCNLLLGHADDSVKTLVAAAKWVRQ